MAIGSDAVWQQLGELGPFAFILGGLAVLTDALLNGLETWAAMAFPEWLHIFLGLGGLWILSIGLIGFYPHVAERTPRLALGGLLAGAVGWLTFTVGLGWSILLDVLGQGTVGEGPPQGTAILLGAVVLVLLSFLLYGLASYRTPAPSKTIGLLLLVPFVSFLVLVGLFIGNGVFGVEPPDGLILVLFGVVAVSVIVNGNLLRVESVPR